MYLAATVKIHNSLRCRFLILTGAFATLYVQLHLTRKL